MIIVTYTAHWALYKGVYRVHQVHLKGATDAQWCNCSVRLLYNSVIVLYDFKSNRTADDCFELNA